MMRFSVFEQEEVRSGMQLSVSLESLPRSSPYLMDEWRENAQLRLPCHDFSSFTGLLFGGMMVDWQVGSTINEEDCL